MWIYHAHTCITRIQVYFTSSLGEDKSKRWLMGSLACRQSRLGEVHLQPEQPE